MFDNTKDTELCNGIDDSICVKNDNGDALCIGDNGSPLHTTVNGKTSVIGVNSQVPIEKVNDERFDLCISGGEAAYTRVSRYMDWIKETIGNNDYCS
jgi:secreted trypsin-like serine protease